MTAPDTRAAEAFEKFLVPTVFGPWSRALVDQTVPKPGERLLDIACGTGAAARYAVGLVGPAGKVAAIDIDPGMIAYGRSLDAAGAIDWRQGDALALPYGDQSFDIVVCNQGFQFFPDRARALAEIRRVLMPGGRLALSVYCPLPYCPAHWAVAKALEKHAVDPAGIQRPYAFGEPLAIGNLIERAGFRDLAVVRRQMEARFASSEAFVQSLAAGGPSARHALEQLSAEGLRALIAEVGDSLAEFIDGDGLKVITTTNFAVARR